MRFRKLQLVPLFVSFAVPWAFSCSSDDNNVGTGGTGATGGTAPTAGTAATTGGTPGVGGQATGGMPSTTGGMAGTTGGQTTTGGSGGAAAGTSGTGGASAGGGGLGGNNIAGDAGMGGEAGMMETGGTAGSGTAGSGTAGSGTAGSGAGGAGAFTVTSPGFENMEGCSETMQASCDTFPVETSNFGDGMNISPQLNFVGVPSDTGSFAVVLQDLSNTQAHWVLWNIPGSATMLAADVPQTSNMPATPAGSQQVNAGFASGDGYFGPGSACNVYEFVVYALQAATFTPTSTTDAAAVRTALEAVTGAALRGKASIRARQAACSGGQMCAPTMNMCVN